VWADLNGRVNAIIDAGPCLIGVESTVVDCTTPVPTLLRPGGITLEMLTAAVGAVEIDPALGGKENIVPRSPGMKYTHYAPNAPMILLEGPAGSVAMVMRQEIDKALAAGKIVGAVVAQETVGLLPSSIITAVYGSRLDSRQVAANLYNALRCFDEQHVDVIYAEGIEEAGIGRAVMNRLRKASGYRIIKV
ncbi:MAG TPA: Sua5 family C-terminal domain-containing protein, partial [Negativicutes bacterium]